MKQLLVPLTLTAALSVSSCSSDSPPTVPSTPAAVQRSLIGAALPDLTLEGYHKDAISKFRLSQFRGKWFILFFYPADFTFVCPTELKELAEYYKEFTASGAEVAAVSTDSAVVHRAWHQQNESVRTVQYPLLSDRAGKLSRALGVYRDDEGTAERATFLVDPEGRIVVYEVHHDAIGRSADELLRKLQAAVAVKRGGGGMCPAGWKPGADMIKTK